MASCVFRRFSPCSCRTFPVERKVNSSQFAFVGNAVGAEGTVCPRPDRRFAKDAVRPLINSKALTPGEFLGWGLFACLRYFMERPIQKVRNCVLRGFSS